MCNQISQYLETKQLLFKHQYGFRRHHSTIHPIIQLLNQCTHANNSRPPQNTLAIFCDLSKAFDVLQHDILLYKLSNLGIRGRALTWMKNYLTNRNQYVAIDQTNSEIETIPCGVPQGSILGPLLYLIYVNDVQSSTSAQILSFADDTTITVSSNNINTLMQKANSSLSDINTWFCANKLFLNFSKTKFIILSPPQVSVKTNHTTLQTANNIIERTNSHKFLGIHIDEHLTWKKHISHVNSKIAHSLFAIKQVQKTLPPSALRTLYFSLIHPHLIYGIHAWGNTASSTLNKTNILMKRAIRLINNAPYNSHSEPLFKKSKILTLPHLHEQQIATFSHDYEHRKLPRSFNNFFQYTRNIKTRNTRSTDLYYIPTPRTSFLQRLPHFHFPQIANKFANAITSLPSRSRLKSTIKTQFIDSYQTTIQCERQRCPDCHPLQQ